jgi:hypothetical protein
MDREMKHLMTLTEEEKSEGGTPRQTRTVERIWNKRPDGLSIKMPEPEKNGEFFILEFKRMSDVTDQYVTWGKSVVVDECGSIKSVLEQTQLVETLDLQGWLVTQRIFIPGSRSVNE